MVPSRVLKLSQAAKQDYINRNPNSKALYERATESLPGGNTRSVLYYPPWPLSITKAHGSRLYDADGHEYIDLLGEYTAGLYGHSEPLILKAITDAAQRGLSYGGQHEDEARLASLIKQRFPSIALLRFTNSGTEATLMAISAAKVYTGKKKILVFAGGYHGGAFSFKGGHNSPVNAPHEYLIAKYNDLPSVERLLQDVENAGQIAAIMVEPMIGSGGAIPADRDFLRGLRRCATDCSAVLIFDEVMTSRLYSGGGIQSTLPPDEQPDMTTLGKYIGGGMSFGAFGGKKQIIELYDPRKPNALAHAGTFNNNVLTMAAGCVGLERVFTPQRAQELHHRGDELRARLQRIGQGTLMQVTGVGSIMSFHFTETAAERIKSPADIGDEHKILYDLLHLFLIDRGFYIAGRGFIALSLALTEVELDGFASAVEDFVQTYRDVLGIPAARARL